MNTATLPKIKVAFRKLASTFLERSERGIAILIVKEDGETSGNDYTPVTASIQEVDTGTDITGWSNANAARINDMLAIAPSKVVIVTIDSSSGTIADATALIEAHYQNGRVTIVSETAGDYSALVTWAKTKKSYHVLTSGVSNADSRYVENVNSQNIVFTSTWDSGRTGQGSYARTTSTTKELLPMIAAILSKANVNGASSKVLTALESCTDVSTPDTVVNNGNIIIYNDWSNGDRVVRLGTAVNTLVTFDDTEADGDKIEDMRYIEVSEAADMIRQDITSVFRDEYSGVRKNSVDNQQMLLGSIQDYLDRLAEDEILNNRIANTVYLDADAQRKAWITVNPDASDWDDATVLAKPFQRNVYLGAEIQILQSMQNLTLNILLD